MPTIPARSGARRIRSLLDRLHRGWGLRLPAKPVTVDSGTSGGWSVGSAGAESGNTGSAGSARSGWIRGSARSAWPTWAGVARVGSLGTELRKTGQFNFRAVLGDGCPGLGSGGHTRTDYPEAGDY